MPSPSSALACAADPTPTGLSISNEFIKIRVNQGPAEAGRFAMDTTGGDPSRPAGANQPLIFGSREPWTSYTTVLVDGKPMLFGGPSDRRAGKGVAVGTVTSEPKIEGEAIVTVSHVGEVEVRQELIFRT